MDNLPRSGLKKVINKPVTFSIFEDKATDSFHV